uniref:Long-chain fatty-acid-CoA ligase n=1 Tax=Chlorobium chlorochromatii (strain CaD3) TaxID=340177 RepID=Q3ARH8_CHLCH
MALINPAFTTLPELFASVFAHYRSNTKAFPVSRKINGVYTPVSYQALYADEQKLQAFLKQRGVTANDRVAILSENRPAWYLADMAILNLGAITVPLYPSLPANQIEYILNNCSAKAVIVSNSLQLSKILSIRNQLTSCEFIVMLNRQTEQIEGVTDLNHAKEEGKKLLAANPSFLTPSPAKPDDVATIIYTSGTTGLPKGVMLTHRNLCENVKSCSTVLELNESDCALSFLPLSHAYERTGGYYLLFACGTQIYIAESIETVSLNMSEVKPTIIFTVPRLFDRIRAILLKQIGEQPPPAQKLFEWALQTGEEYYQALSSCGSAPPLLAMQHNLASQLIYKKIHQKMGGRLRYFVSGGAALPQKIGEFFQALDVPILEGFGLTETSPVTHVNRPEKIKYGTVGKAINNVETRIAEDGEILLKGPNIMKGYWNDEEATREVLKDGWFYTGDLGEIDSDGYLKITGRKKHIIVTSGGKNIAPLPIENLIAENPFIGQVLVIGEKRPFLVALIVPAFPHLQAHARKESIQATTNRELMEHKKVQQIYEELLRTISMQLATHEKIRKFILIENPFTIENEQMTPTLKLRRDVIINAYANDIENAYNSLNMCYNAE